MRFLLAAFTVFIFCFTTKAQGNDLYSVAIQEADNLYDKGEYKASGLKFSEAFQAYENSVYDFDRYNAACSYALAKMLDSAFSQLNRICTVGVGGYSEYDHMSKDSDFKNLYGDSRWDVVLGNTKENQYQIQKNYDWDLISQLKKIYESDQGGRHKIDDVAEKHGRDSPEMTALWKEINSQDSVNLISVQKILDERGWLGSEVVSPIGNSTLFLVIQHSDLSVQEKYLSMMRDAAKKGNARRSSLALLEDRIALRQGKRQIYGSQIGRNKETGESFVLPLEDPENVDDRRAMMDLGPLSEYATYFDFEWDLQKHFSQTIDYEKKNKKEIRKKRKAAKKRGTY